MIYKFFLNKRIKKAIKRKEKIKKENIYRYSQASRAIKKIEKLNKTYPRKAVNFTSKQLDALNRIKTRSGKRVVEINDKINILKDDLK